MHPPPRLLGRIEELEILRQLIASVRDGQSAVVVVRGEPGIGKTELLGALIAEASGFRVVHVAGVESEMELAYAGLHQLCSPLMGGIEALAEPQQRGLSVALGLESREGDGPDQFLVALATLGLMAEASEEQPLLCVVDDAQWLDQASAQVLGFVGRRLLAESIALVFAARTPVLPPDPLEALPDPLEAPPDPLEAPPDPLAGLPELRLGGLGTAAARALLATEALGPLDERVRARIVEETGGNPLALLELGRGLGVAELAGGFALPDAGDLPRLIEDQYVERLGTLPPDAQRLVLLAAADPVGDVALILRAAQRLGLNIGVLEAAAEAGFLDVGANLRFRHPLMRSAVYRAAAGPDRRAVHDALAAATDPLSDPDRRAWHRAHAAAGPDEAVAGELINSAGRALRRGGIAAAAAFWARAVALTPDARERAMRALTAAEAKYAAGDFLAAQALLVTAEVGPQPELGQARIQRMRAQIAFALRRGSDAPPLLLQAAQRLQDLDPELARRTYIEAMVAMIYAGRLARGPDPAEVARAARLAPYGPVEARPLPHAQLLLRGLAVRLTDGYRAAAPLLKEALRRYRAQPQELDWLCVSYNMVAMDLWDDEAWFELAAGQVRLARANGTLSWLPFALDYLAELHIQAGELPAAAALLLEGERIDPGIRAATLPYVSLLLAAWRGDAPAADELAQDLARGAAERGEGAALTYADYARAVLRQRPRPIRAGRRGGARRQRRRGACHLAVGAVRADRGGGAEQPAGAGRRRGRPAGRDRRGERDRLGPRGGGPVPGPAGLRTRRRRGVPRGDRAAGPDPDGGARGPGPADLRRMAAPGEPPDRRPPPAAARVRRAGRDGRPDLRRTRPARAPGHRGEGAQAARGPGHGADPAGGGDRPAGARGTDQLRDRRAAVHRGPHRGMAPAQGVRQARHQLPPRGRRGPATTQQAAQTAGRRPDGAPVGPWTPRSGTRDGPGAPTGASGRPACQSGTRPAGLRPNARDS